MRGRRIPPASYARAARNRSALRLSALLIAVAAAAACRGGEDRLVLLLCVDTLRADHVSSYGYERETTPAIDALARDGVRFVNAFSTSPWTVPAVASLLTSREVFEHGAGVPGESKHLSERSPGVQFPRRLPSLAERLTTAGVETALLSANPFLHGRFREGFGTAKVERVDAGQLVDRALGWLDAHPAGRRFLYLHLMDVHQPNVPPEPWFSMFPAPDGSPREERHGDWTWSGPADPADAGFARFRAHRIGAYDGAIRYVDAQIARLLSGLERRGERRRALVVVTADHGEEFWDHAEVQAAWADDPRGLTGIGHGHTLFEELLRIPMIVAGAGVRPRDAARCPVSILDVAPTVLEAFGLPPAPDHRGRSLLARAEPEGCAARELWAGALAYGPDSLAVREERWKLSVRGGRAPVLADLVADPAEAADATGRAPRIAARLGERLTRARAAAGPDDVTATPLDAEQARELRALGYL